LAKVFRGKFRAGLRQLYTGGKLACHGQLQALAPAGQFETLRRQACGKNWVVYAKRPFAGPDAVLANRHRHARIVQARAALPGQSRKTKPTAKATPPVTTVLPICPHCRQPSLILLRVTHAIKPSRPRYADSS
jgi:hypothetical protein